MDPRYPAHREDTYLVNLRFRSGAIGRVLGAYGLVHPPLPMESLSLFGTRGSLVDYELVLDRLPGHPVVRLDYRTEGGYDGHGGRSGATWRSSPAACGRGRRGGPVRLPRDRRGEDGGGGGSDQGVRAHQPAGRPADGVRPRLSPPACAPARPVTVTHRHSQGPIDTHRAPQTSRAQTARARARARARGGRDGEHADAKVGDAGGSGSGRGLLPACGASGQGGDAGSGEAPRSAAPVTVGFMQCGQQRADFYGGALLQSFKARHPNVTLDFQTVECGTTYLDKMVALLVGGTPPDVWDTGQGAFAEYTKQNAALALDPYIARDRSIDFPDFEPASMYALDGKRHMLPYDTGVNVLYYNTELWQRAGLPNPRQQWTAKRWDWAAFLDAVTRLSATTAADGATAWPTRAPRPGASAPSCGRTAATGRTGRRTSRPSTGPPAVEALLFVADLAQKHRVMPTPATQRGRAARPSPTAGWRWR